MTFSAVTFVAFDCLYANTLIDMINVGSTALTYYNSVPVGCCNLLTSLLESTGLLGASVTNCVFAPYMGGFHVCGACYWRAGAGCSYLWRAALMYPGIDKFTVRFM
jgi:hypothetical protein